MYGSSHVPRIAKSTKMADVEQIPLCLARISSTYEPRSPGKDHRLAKQRTWQENDASWKRQRVPKEDRWDLAKRVSDCES